jgi:hypothetical protein
MNARIRVLAFALALVALALTATSEPYRQPTQQRENAELVVVGKVHDLTFTRHTYGGDGVCIRCLAEVLVTSVERGAGAWGGEKINIRWIEVVRQPGRPVGGVSRHVFRMKADDVVRFWLMRDGKSWTIIDNPNGVENLTVR